MNMLIPRTARPAVEENIGRTDFLDWCKKRFPEHENDLYIYHHKVTGNFILAGKTLRDGWIVDIYCFGLKFTPSIDDRRAIEHILDPLPDEEFDFDKVQRTMQSNERALDAEHLNEVKELTEMSKHMVRTHDPLFSKYLQHLA
jgi:hypothetical protein